MDHDPHLMRTYFAPPFDAARGEGSWLYDTEGNAYLDFTSGIAVNAVGHAHPRWSRAVADQAGRLAHSSNLFGVPEQKRLAERLVARAGPGRAFFCNSGAEANEALIKLARLHGQRLSAGEEGQRYEIVVAENAFHGRTFGGMAATPKEAVRAGYHPMLPGFRTAPLNDINAFEKAVNANTAAVMIETVQGEGGVYPADSRFLRDLRALCSQNEILMILDEVQCGVGRTGQFFAYETAGVQPDAIGMAKGLGGGFPMGAIWATERHASLFEPGAHGTTFGGSPLGCAAAHAVLDVIEEERLLERVRRQAAPWHERLRALVDRHPKLLAELRGRGYMVAFGLRGESGPDVARAARGEGLLCAPAGKSALRLLPPLNAAEGELDAAVERLDAALARVPEPGGDA